MLGSELVLKCLHEEGVDTIFGYSGGAVIPIFDALYKDERFRLIRPVHEQGGTHAADGYARASGKVGVMIVTSGPGVTNAVTGIASAFMDSSPLVVISGQVASSLLGKTSFQEVDATGITGPITKRNFLVKNISEIPEALSQAFYIAKSGRPGPVLVDITKDALQASIEEPDYKSLGKKEDRRQTLQKEEGKRILEAIRKSERPVIYAGGGVLKAGASEELKAFAEKLNIPVVNSIMGLGSFDRSSPLSYGIVGMHGDRETNLLVYNADLIIGLGVRFSDRAIGNRGGFSKEAKIIHIDTDPGEFGKNLTCDYSLTGDLKEILKYLTENLDMRFSDRYFQNQEREVERGFIPTLVLEKLMEYFPEDTIVVTDVGQHQMRTVRRRRFKYPRTLITSGGLGTMGFGMGAAIGAKLACPERPVLLITGDGSFRMDQQELLTATSYKIPLTVLIFDNKTLGMVRQRQALFNDKRYSETDVYDNLRVEDLARAYGANFLGSPQTIYDLEEILKGLKTQEGVNIIDFVLDHNIAASPMVAAGDSINHVIEKVEY